MCIYSFLETTSNRIEVAKKKKKKKKKKSVKNRWRLGPIDFFRFEEGGSRFDQ